MKLIIKSFDATEDDNIVRASAHLDQGGQGGLTTFGDVELTPDELNRLMASLAKGEALTVEIHDENDDILVSA